MKSIYPKQLLILSFIMCLVISGYGQNQLPELKTDGKNIINESGEILQLHGVCFSDPDKLEHDGHWDYEYFQKAKEWGSNIVRFAVHPTRLNERGWDEYFELLDKGIEWATQLEMYVIIDWHIIGNLNTEKWFRPMYNTTNEETVRFWETVAKRYNGNTTVAVYELYNEPTNVGGTLGDLNWDILRQKYENLIDKVNTIDDKNIFLVAGLNWGYSLTEVVDNPVNRKNIAYCTHPYPQKREEPWEPKWESDWGHVADKYPIIATEFGFMDSNDRGAHKPCIADEEYGRKIINYFDEKNISYAVWCFDPDWPPCLIKDWDFTPTRQGAFFRSVMLERY